MMEAKGKKQATTVMDQYRIFTFYGIYLSMNITGYDTIVRLISIGTIFIIAS